MKIEKRILDNLYSQLEKLIQHARQNVVQAVNLTMVATYYNSSWDFLIFYQKSKKHPFN